MAPQTIEQALTDIETLLGSLHNFENTPAVSTGSRPFEMAICHRLENIAISISFATSRFDADMVTNGPSLLESVTCIRKEMGLRKWNLEKVNEIMDGMLHQMNKKLSQDKKVPSKVLENWTVLYKDSRGDPDP
ncbi:MAG: hypothetical protein Q9226_008834 [Calogaya cf. arnoldii]